MSDWSIGTPGKSARFVRDVSYRFRGTAHLYKVHPPVTARTGWHGNDAILQKTSFIVVSAVIVPAGLGPETYIFPSNDQGEAILIEMMGSQKGTLDIEQVLRDAGYTVSRSEK